MMLRKNRSKKYYKLTLFIFVFIFLFSIFTPSSPINAGDIGKSCINYDDCPSNNICVKAAFGSFCYPKIGGGCNKSSDCQSIEKILGIIVFCDPTNPVDNYLGKCNSNNQIPKTTGEIGEKCVSSVNCPPNNQCVNINAFTNRCYPVVGGGCNQNTDCKYIDGGFCSPVSAGGLYMGTCAKAIHEKIPTKTPDLNPLGNLQVKIPGLDEIAAKHPIKCEGEGESQTCKIPWIAIYIHAIYNYLLGIGGVLAAIALMVGGVIWLVSAGNASRVSEAKSWITGSVTGLLILFTSYIILYQINPNLVGLKYIELKTIDPIELPEGDIKADNQGTTIRKTTKYIIIHTAAGLVTRDQVDKFHRSKGWNGIGYNMYIERNGNMVTGRGEDVVGAHSVKYNSVSIGISYSGCYDKSQWSNKTTADAIKNKTITQAQLDTLIAQIKHYQAKYKIPRSNVLGHYEEPVSKACPCLPMEEIRSLINP